MSHPPHHHRPIAPKLDEKDDFPDLNPSVAAFDRHIANAFPSTAPEPALVAHAHAFDSLTQDAILQNLQTALEVRSPTVLSHDIPGIHTIAGDLLLRKPNVAVNPFPPAQNAVDWVEADGQCRLPRALPSRSLNYRPFPGAGRVARYERLPAGFGGLELARGGRRAGGIRKADEGMGVAIKQALRRHYEKYGRENLVREADWSNRLVWPRSNGGRQGVQKTTKTQPVGVHGHPTTKMQPMRGHSHAHPAPNIQIVRPQVEPLKMQPMRMPPAGIQRLETQPMTKMQTTRLQRLLPKGEPSKGPSKRAP